MADESYWQWYANAFGNQPTPGPSPGPAPLSPAQWADFYRSVGITGAQGNAPTTKVVKSVPVPGSGPSHVTSYATLSGGSSVPEDYRYAAGQIGAPRINAKTPDRLMASAPGIDYAGGGMSPMQVAQIGTDLLGNKPTPYPRPRPPTGAPTTMLAQAVPPKVAPVPFQRPTAVATALDVVPPPPMPIPRPINRGQPMPPMPIPRPGIGGPEGPAAPGMGLFGIKLPQLPQIPVQAIQQAFTTPKANPVPYDRLTGTFLTPLSGSVFATNQSSGGAHGGSDNDKHRGEPMMTKRRY